MYTAAGCVLVPLDVLLEPYDGPTPTLVDEDRIFAETLAALGHGGEDDEDADDEDADERGRRHAGGLGRPVRRLRLRRRHACVRAASRTSGD
ncbi:hypothetical protein ABZ400_05665 [Streptomyces sp. NPDC005897]|uniref:hypothetical protein n=1 Tax=Streptomyces sp. NPDC005897 TaxID=3157081 RepID=UPI00340DB79D